MCYYVEIRFGQQIVILIYSDCLFLLILIIYATATSPARIEIRIKKVPSSLTVPFGKIARNAAERYSNISNHHYYAGCGN